MSNQSEPVSEETDDTQAGAEAAQEQLDAVDEADSGLAVAEA